MWIETTLLAYIGLAYLARASHRYRTRHPAVARVIGWALLAAGQTLAWNDLGAAQGIVAFLCVTMAAGLALVLLLSLSPRTALAVTAPLRLA